MPRPPTYPSVIRSARQILGLSQIELARRTNMAKITLNKIENGQMGVSLVVAQQIACELLVSRDQIRENSDPLHPKLLGTQEPLTLENWQELRKRMKEVPKERYNRAFKELSGYVERLLSDSAKAGRFDFAAGFLLDAIADVRLRIGLIRRSEPTRRSVERRNR